MTTTSIEWADRVWNPVRGCTRVSEGCRHCYAERMASRNLPEFRSPTTGKPFAHSTPQGPRWTGKVELIPSKLAEPLRVRKPQRWFVNSMSDLFHESLSSADIAAVFGVMACAPQHTFLVLTKRANRLRQWCTGMAGAHVADLGARFIMSASISKVRADFPSALQIPAVWPLPNVWLGTSVEDQPTADARIPELLRTPAAVRWISLEPQLAFVDLWPWLSGHKNFSLDWVVQGGESGPGARPFDVSWAERVREQCLAARTPYFLKQLGARPRAYDDVACLSAPLWLKDRKGGDMAEWPEDIRVREFPAARA